MEVSNVRWEIRQFRPLLICTIDGKESIIGTESQKKTWIDYGLVFLGSNFEQSHVALVPDALTETTPIRELRGFTDDKGFFENVFAPFIEAIVNDSFEPKVF